MRQSIQVLMLSVGFSLATIGFGWWAVPLLAFAWGIVARDERKPGDVVALAAGLGWVWVLGWTAFAGPAGELARRASGVLGIPRFAFVAVTLVFPMLLAWGAGVVGAVVAGARVGSRKPGAV